MADKAVSELIEAERITATDLFVLEQNGTAKKLTGQVLLNWLTSAADGHGGIQNITKLKTEGLADTYRITLADTTVFDFVVTNGRGISKIQKTSTQGLIDTYIITYNDGTTGSLTVTNGEKGEKGDNTYVWIKYASTEPTEASHSFGSLPDDWIGIYFGPLAEAPADWKEYAWYQIKGEKGETGEPARIVSASVTYQLGDSGTIIPSGVWSDSIAVVPQGKYLWTRTVTQFNTGAPITAYSVSRMGMDGSGAVSSVAGVSPDPNGNVPLTAEDVKALSIAGGTMSGPINMNGQALKGLNAPTADDEAVNWGSVKDLGKAKAGFIYPLAAAVVPEGFLLCDGAAYERSEYPELFAAIGTMYGSGDGATTFNVPDLRNRVPAGSSENHPAGEMVGEEAHQLTVDEMPSHTHTTRTLGNTYTSSIGSSLDAAWYAVNDNYNSGATGGDQPHNNMQPTTYIHGYIIATGKGTAVSIADIILGAQAIPLGLEYGGVGATDPKTARENLEITPENIGAEPAGAVRMELLWENASPTSAFSAQTISLDLSAYTHVLVSALVNKDKSYIGHVSAIAKIGDKHRVEGIAGHINLRYFIASANGVVFEDAQWVETYGGSGIATNNSMIPTRIYGIKGVSV